MYIQAMGNIPVTLTLTVMLNCLPGSGLNWDSLAYMILKIPSNYAVYACDIVCQFQMGRKKGKVGQIGENRQHSKVHTLSYFPSPTNSSEH